MGESMAGVSLSKQELAAFTRGMAANYVALMRERNLDRFTQVQQQQMVRAINAGVNVTRILAAIDSAAALARAMMPGEGMMVSFASSIAKMVAAQAQIEANK